MNYKSSYQLIPVELASDSTWHKLTEVAASAWGMTMLIVGLAGISILILATAAKYLKPKEWARGEDWQGDKPTGGSDCQGHNGFDCPCTDVYGDHGTPSPD